MEENEIEAYFRIGFEVPLLFNPYNCIDGLDHPNIFVIPKDSPNSIWPSRWGLIPEGCSESPEQYHRRCEMVYAPAEQLFLRGPYRSAILENRCLVLCNGFFLLPKDGEQQNLTYCYQGSGKPFLLAGIYIKHGDELYTCAIITVQEKFDLGKIGFNNTRMPMVMDPEFENEWLRDDLNEDHIKALISFGSAKKDLSFHHMATEFEVLGPGRHNSVL